MTQMIETPGAANGDRSLALPSPVIVQRRVVEDNGPLAFIMDTARFEHLKQIASVMSLMSVLPDHLQLDKKKMPLALDQVKANCFRIVNQACRWGIDPFAMVDETFVIGGKLGYSGKLVAAVVNTRAGLEERLDYKHSGSGDDRTVKVIGKFKGESKAREVELRVGDAKTDNQMWRKDPDQKLVYSAVVKWARRYCPEIMLGILTEDDLERIAEQVRPELPSEQTTGAAGLVQKLKNREQSPVEQSTMSEDEANKIIEQRAAETRAKQTQQTRETPAPPAERTSVKTPQSTTPAGTEAAAGAGQTDHSAGAGKKDEDPPADDPKSRFNIFIDECLKLGTEVGVPEDVINRGIGRTCVRLGIKGKEWEMTDGVREEIKTAIKQKSGHFAV